MINYYFYYLKCGRSYLLAVVDVTCVLPIIKIMFACQILISRVPALGDVVAMCNIRRTSRPCIITHLNAPHRTKAATELGNKISNFEFTTTARGCVQQEFISICTNCFAIGN